MKFSGPQTVRTPDHRDERDKELIPTREEVAQSRKLVEEVRRGKTDQSKSDKNS